MFPVPTHQPPLMRHLLTGPTVMRGYLGREPLPEPRWHTGDLVRLDGEGRLRFLGRSDDQIEVHGVRVDLHPIEAALRAHPAVEDAAAAKAEERVVAIYRGDAIDESELRRFLAEGLPAPAVPAVVRRVEAVPRSANGKVDRRAAAAPAVC